MKLGELFKTAITTGDMWFGQLDTFAVVYQILATTLGLSVQKAEEAVSRNIETSRVSREADKRWTTPRTSHTVKAWKEAFMFGADPDKTLAAAVAWLNMDTYNMSTDIPKGIVAAIRAMFAHINCEATFIVNGEVREPGFVRALLGHCSLDSTKIR